MEEDSLSSVKNKLKTVVNLIYNLQHV